MGKTTDWGSRPVPMDDDDPTTDWMDDAEIEIYRSHAETRLWKKQSNAHYMQLCEVEKTSADQQDTITEQAATLGVDKLILGTTKRSLVEQALRGDIIRTVSELLPDEIQLAIYRN